MGVGGKAARKRAVGTREHIIAYLTEINELFDANGMASTQRAAAVGYPGSSVAFAQLLSGMERSGLIKREVRGKRTYRITLGHTHAAGPGGLGRPARIPGTEVAAGAGVAARIGEAAGTGGVSVVGGAGEVGVVGTGGGVGVFGTGGGVGVVGTGSGVGVVGTGSGVGVVGTGSGVGVVGGADGEAGSADVGPVGFDYDELARRLLVQVVRRLAAAKPEAILPGQPGQPGQPDQATLQETVAGLEYELATAWTKHAKLAEENVRLREQLQAAQRSLALAAERVRRLPGRSGLDSREVMLLQRLLASGGEDSLAGPDGPDDPGSSSVEEARSVLG